MNRERECSRNAEEGQQDRMKQGNGNRWKEIKEKEQVGRTKRKIKRE